MIAPGFKLDASAVTQTFGVLAMRGAGKSNLAAAMAEDFFAAGYPFVAIDPVGSWWGLRAAGERPGLGIPVFGGQHADVPLERGAGALIADLVVDERLTCVVDVSDMSEGDKIRFLCDFAERLYRRNSEPLHLFLEEADDYAPQRPFREQARLLRAWENIVRRGRARGLGITMVTQRSAALNKNVLTQIETLFVLRMTSPQDRAAIEAWLKHQGREREVLDSLPELQTGEAWVWSPQYLKAFKRIHVRRRHTFDSGATPEVRKRGRRAATLADVDLGAIRTAMADTIERAQAEDPRALRRRIAELEKQVAAKPRGMAPKSVSVLSSSDRAAIQSAIERLERVVKKGAAASEAVEKTAERFASDVAAVTNQAGELVGRLIGIRRAHDAVPPATPATPATVPRDRRVAPTSGQSTVGVSLGPGERAILVAIAQLGPATREKLTVVTSYKRSTRNTYLQRLGAQGLIAEQPEGFVATGEGLAVLGTDYEPLPTGDELREYWLKQLPLGEAAILRALTQAHPNQMSRDALSEATGYTRSSRNTYLQRLSARGIVTINRELVRAHEDLFG